MAIGFLDEAGSDTASLDPASALYCVCCSLEIGDAGICRQRFGRSLLRLLIDDDKLAT